MLTIYPITTLALVLALIVYFALSVNVGRARATWNVPAPQASGHPEFDKRYRVQMNTLELMVLFIPALYLAARYWPPAWVAACVRPATKLWVRAPSAS